MENRRKRDIDKVHFEVQDFCQLTYANNSFFGVIAYYAIVNLTMDQIKTAFLEVHRVLKDHGLFMFGKMWLVFSHACNPPPNVHINDSRAFKNQM